MKILLLGCNGQVGWELQRSLSSIGHVISLDANTSLNPDEFKADFTDLDGLRETVRLVQPQVIVNAAAHTAVDKAETEQNLVHTINALAPQVLAEEALNLNAWLVHYSTDYVFNGSGSSPWDEQATPEPLNVYGASKLAGEIAVARNPKHLILRTSWVYAARGGNFAKTMLRLASERDVLNVISDQVGAPTSAELLADVTAHTIRALNSDPSLAGLYHCTASGETSWHGYCRYVLTVASELAIPLRTTSDKVQAISTSDYPTPAKRPLNSRLNTKKFETKFGLTLPQWETGVKRMLTEISGK